MKLYLYDAKHEQIHDELEIKDSEVETVKKVIEFLDKNGLTSRYNELILAHNYSIVHEDEEYNPVVVFTQDPY